MTVSEWIRALSEMDPDHELRAMDLRGEWVAVAPIAVRRVKAEPMRRTITGPFVKVVRDGDQWAHTGWFEADDVNGAATKDAPGG